MVYINFEHNNNVTKLLLQDKRMCFSYKGMSATKYADFRRELSKVSVRFISLTRVLRL